LAAAARNSTTGLGKNFMRYIRKYNESTKPIKWKYADPTRLIMPLPSH
jgi:hypothetical protein